MIPDQSTISALMMTVSSVSASLRPVAWPIPSRRTLPRRGEKGRQETLADDTTRAENVVDDARTASKFALVAIMRVVALNFDPQICIS